MNFQEFEEKCDIIREKNYEYINLFQADLIQHNLSIKTINRHTDNVDFYLNVFLLREDLVTMERGCGSWFIEDFFGYFFICKCMWSTPGSIKTTASSIKKFYKCMLNHDKIKKEQYDYLCETIKYGMGNWVSDCERYNNYDESNPFNPFA